MSITTVGIVGAGTMGNGIAQACAVSGINVVMVDIAQAAVDKGLVTIGMCGQFTGEMDPLCDHLISVPTKDTPLVQEVHIAAGHMLCHVVDHFLFESVMELGQG